LAPASRKTAAMSPAMIHRVRFIINSLIEDYLYHTRQDGSPGCDTSEHLARESGRGGGNAGDRLATPARRTSPTAHREDHLAIGIGHDGKRVFSPAPVHGGTA
jgi:hypothetical protein